MNEVNFKNVLFIFIFIVILGAVSVWFLNYTSFDDTSIFAGINNPNSKD